MPLLSGKQAEYLKVLLTCIAGFVISVSIPFIIIKILTPYEAASIVVNGGSY